VLSIVKMETMFLNTEISIIISALAKIESKAKEKSE
jgi:hypothetical protein